MAMWGLIPLRIRPATAPASSNEAKVSLNVKALPDARDDQYSLRKTAC